MEAFEAAGITAVANERACPLIDMDRRRCVDVELPEGRAIHSLRVCEDVFDFDVIVVNPRDENAHAHGGDAGREEHEGVFVAAEQGGVAHAATHGRL